MRLFNYYMLTLPIYAFFKIGSRPALLSFVCSFVCSKNLHVFYEKKKSVKEKMELFYEEVNHKRKEKMGLHTDLEFQQNEIKKLNKKYNVEMFSTRVRGGKAFAAEQKIREFKKLPLKIKSLYKKMG